MTTDEAAAALQTNRHGRAALGIVAENLQRGYEVADSIRPPLATQIMNPVFGLVESFTDADLRRTAREMLDVTNAYAGGLFAVLPDDDQPLPANMKANIGEALHQAERNLSILVSVRQNVVQTFLEDLQILVDAIFEVTAEATKYIADKAKKIVGSVVPVQVWYALGAALLVGVGVYAWRLAK